MMDLAEAETRPDDVGTQARMHGRICLGAWKRSYGPLYAVLEYAQGCLSRISFPLVLPGGFLGSFLAFFSTPSLSAPSLVRPWARP